MFIFNVTLIMLFFTPVKCPLQNIFLMFIFERERQSESRGGTERDGDTESEVGSRLQAVGTEPDVGLRLTNCEIMT